VLKLRKTKAEERTSLYEDVEALLTQGFITSSLRINSVRLSLRSLGPGDVFVLRSRVGSGTDHEWQVWALASATWLLNGQVLLGDPQATVRVYEVFRGLSRGSLDKMFIALLELFRRQSKAMTAVEPFCYETSSRFLWRTYGGHHPASHAGIPGVDSLGTNNIQRMWTFFNVVEDQRIHDDTMWEGFKLSVSATSPKGVQKIDKRDQQLRQEELERRQMLQDRFFYLTKGVIKEEDKNLMLEHQVKTVVDLEEELRRWIAGEEDDHDRAIREYKERILARYEQEKEARERRRAELIAQQDSAVDETEAPLQVYTPEQVRDLLRGQPSVSDTAAVKSAAQEHLRERFLETYPMSTPVGEDLTQRLASRQVSFRTEESED